MKATEVPLDAQAILGKLVAFNTVSSVSNLELIEWVEQFLHRHDIPTERVPNEDGSKASLLARIGPDVAGGVVLSGHTDVVPVEGQPWQTEPFTLSERDGRLYGRGSCDMKGFLACALATVPHWQQLDLQRPIWLALSYDEEIGCLGAPDMIEQLMAHHPRPDSVIIGEPTLMAPVTQQKGITSLRTTVHGVEAHSSQIPQGISAIHAAARLIERIENIMGELEAEKRLNNAFNVPYSSLHVGRVQGGTAINIMARQCRFDWEIRHLPEDGFDEVFERFTAASNALEQELTARNPHFALETERLTPTVPALADRNNERVLALCDTLLGAREREAVAFATEGGQFQNAGLQVVICGPGSIAQAHQPDEYIESDQLKQCAIFMHRLGEQLTELN
ncbi:acetylornithine deacetylase [Kushneria phosphatilytica]|uniref:Acetylornithine deacetylase n=1 Tax=Kushneria phosphatilytica TaxID=657387 RepID=A0A1S1NX78_9GAMM|nr:acetylornithine deacetylase [Kushneria phosphatilytica]OHV12182.1 acetylornithine deacetylase (ArgE) [Kushneria phosphatilytica]QEL11374.1 acetylornithine deacetylase [Kushneria phosphatilytica]